MKLKYLLFSVMMLAVVAGCRKDSFEGTPAGNSGATYVRFMNYAATAPRVVTFFSPFTDVKAVQIFDLRREAHSNSSLNSTVTVELIADQAGLAEYNTAHKTSIVYMPETMYTASNAGFVKTATGYTVTFAPGEYSKPFIANVDGSKFDLSKTYALMFKVGNITGDAKITGVEEEASILSTMSIKNAYDGIYSISDGFIQRYLNPTTVNPDLLSGTLVGNPNVTLSSIDATTVEITGMYWSLASNGSLSGLAGVDNLRLVVDPSTNLVTVKSLGNASLANIAGAVNKWDPATKTFTLNFDWNQTSTKRAVTNFKIKYSASR